MQLYKFTIGKKTQYKLLSDDDYQATINHLKKTNWIAITKQFQSQEITDEIKSNTVVKVTNQSIIDFYKTNEIISQFDIHDFIMNSWDVKYINIFPKDSYDEKTHLTKKHLQFNRFYKTESSILNSDVYHEMKHYLDTQYSRAYPILNTRREISNVLSTTDNPTPIFNTMIDAYHIDFNDRKIPIFQKIGIQSENIEWHNNVVIKKFLIFLVLHFDWKKVIYEFIPKIAKSITHAQYLQNIPQIKNLIMTDEKLRSMIQWNIFLQIYSYYENIESQNKWNRLDKSTRLLDLDFVQHITVKDIPIACGLDLTDTVLIKPIKMNLSPLRTTDNAIAKFHKLTDNLFKSALTNFNQVSKIPSSGKFKKRISEFYFCGSILQRIILRDSDEYNIYYKNSDIDVVCYPLPNQSLEDWANQHLIPFIDGESTIEKIETSTSGSYKLWIHTSLGKKIEVFTSKRNILQLISRFHSNCVRAITNGQKIYMFASGLESYLTKTNNKLWWNPHPDPYNLHKIVAKMISRGWAQRIHKKDLKSIGSYLKSEKIDYIVDDPSI
jgi:hypothetical protein